MRALIWVWMTVATIGPAPACRAQLAMSPRIFATYGQLLDPWPLPQCPRPTDGTMTGSIGYWAWRDRHWIRLPVLARLDAWGAGYESATDLHGQFVLRGVPEGTRTLWIQLTYPDGFDGIQKLVTVEVHRGEATRTYVDFRESEEHHYAIESSYDRVSYPDFEFRSSDPMTPHQPQPDLLPTVTPGVKPYSR